MVLVFSIKYKALKAFFLDDNKTRPVTANLLWIFDKDKAHW